MAAKISSLIALIFVIYAEASPVKYHPRAYISDNIYFDYKAKIEEKSFDKQPDVDNETISFRESPNDYLLKVIPTETIEGNDIDHDLICPQNYRMVGNLCFPND